MPTLLTPLTDERVAAFRDGDERAFEYIVGARFDALVERGRLPLGDDSAAAPRVALAVLLSAWTDRGRFPTGASLDEYLEDQVPHRAADELRRRAALHRFEQHEGVHLTPPNAKPSMTASQAWDEIASRLHVSQDELDEHREESRRIARRHAREHVDTVASRGVPVSAIVTGVVLLAVVVGFVWFMDRGSAEQALTTALQSSEVRTLSAAPGQRSTVTLLDGSTAQMGAETTLRIPRGFGDKLRGLELTGASHFTVAQDRTPDFQVLAKGAAIIATGTDFVVDAYEDDTEVFVMVREGSVRVHPVRGELDSETLNAGEALAISADGSTRPLNAQERTAAFSWVDGQIHFTDVTVQEAVHTLKRWHALDATLADASLGTRRISTMLSLESDALALDSVTAAGKLVATYDGEKLILRDVADPLVKTSTLRQR